MNGTLNRKNGPRGVPAAPKNGGDGGYRFDAFTGQTEILYKCLCCGRLVPRGGWVPGACSSCGAPATEFVLVDED